MTASCPVVDDERAAQASNDRSVHVPAGERPLRVDVDGEVFDVAARPDRPGAYDYTWVSGPNPGYGFVSASSDRRPSTMADHEEAIRNFLSQVEPETGYIQ
jgi:hypothetical protein